VSRKRCGTLPARSSNVSRRGVIHHALAPSTRDRLSHREGVQGLVPAEGLGVSWAHSMRPYRPTASRCSGMLPRVGAPQFLNLPQEWGQGVDE
jgi:hypothetical protein